MTQLDLRSSLKALAHTYAYSLQTRICYDMQIILQNLWIDEAEIVAICVNKNAMEIQCSDPESCQFIIEQLGCGKYVYEVAWGNKGHFVEIKIEDF